MSPIGSRLRKLRRMKRQRDVDALIRELSGSSESGLGLVRARAARYLGDLQAQEAVTPLIRRLLSDKDDLTRAAAAKALGKIGSREAVPGLIRALADRSGPVRALTLSSLGEIGDPVAIPHMLAFLDEPDWRFRGVTLYALSVLDDPVANDAAREHLQQAPSSTRRAVARDVRKYKKRLGRGG